MCDPLLAGLPLDPDFSVSYQYSPPSPSAAGFPAHAEKWSSSDKPLDFKTYWSRTSELEAVGPTASEAIKPLDTISSKGKVKSAMIVPDSQKFLRCELESLKTQLQAQTKAFEFLNHSVTMLEKESCLQQIKIQQLEDLLTPSVRQVEKEGQKWTAEQGRQELYGALAQGLRGLQKTLRDGEEMQRARTTRCLQLLAQEIRDSKKFLWEELELVREEVSFIYQKLQAQEEEISENLMNIQKMQKTQVKCRKVLTKMTQQGCDPAACAETEGEVLEGSNYWKNDLQKELSDIWSAVHGLQNSIDGLNMSPRSRPRASNLKGRKGHRCLSPQLHSWDSDSDWEPPPFTNSQFFPPGANPPSHHIHSFPHLACDSHHKGPEGPAAPLPWVSGA
ncbi:coiled-coil domain-containing protein 159 isoform X2 [Perognathus longimembris pacificus]|uniref:coiled-coil domain-containing protein 159 isoform X2 n=1 Tax=Perognathus longimembris pacificus TaxID=214514 RepID=UPI0020187AB2|nr:coiled-coil domain-containing protein 159 isoform X2 [Perognathus longimembris pacificus]